MYGGGERKGDARSEILVLSPSCAFTSLLVDGCQTLLNLRA
jgi:hypothetical protein